jgi:hypothetical protein
MNKAHLTKREERYKLDNSSITPASEALILLKNKHFFMKTISIGGF